jgi:hypothetical protein
MKYTFTTPKNERVALDRALLTGKVKVYVDGKHVGPSHQGKGGAAGTFYQIKSGTLEVRSGLFEFVPRLWYNEDWVELVPPLKTWQVVLIALPFLSATMVSFGQIIGLLVGVLATLLCWLVMRTQRTLGARVALCIAISVLAPVLSIVLTVALNVLLNGGAVPGGQ